MRQPIGKEISLDILSPCSILQLPIHYRFQQRPYTSHIVHVKIGRKGNNIRRIFFSQI